MTWWDYQFVKKAMEKHSGWEKSGFNAPPFDREEIVSIWWGSSNTPHRRYRHKARTFAVLFGGYLYPRRSVFCLVWWFGGWLIANDDDLSAFADFAGPDVRALVDLIGSGDL